jgi:hypothetical protein
VQLGQDQIRHQEIAVMLQFGFLFVAADLLAYLAVETSHHLAKEQRHLLLQNAVGCLADEFEEHSLSFAHDIYCTRMLMLTPI